MAYKPENIGRSGGRFLVKNARRRARQDAKKAATRLARRAAKADPEFAPVRRIVRGYLD